MITLVTCGSRAVRHDFPFLHNWLRRLYWNYPAFKDTTNFEREPLPPPAFCVFPCRPQTDWQ